MVGRRFRVLGLAAAMVAILSGGWAFVSSRRVEAALVEARRLMESDRFAEARTRLLGLRARGSARAEINYRLGVCLHAAGNIPGAITAWSLVDPQGPWGAEAGLARARTLVGDLGRFVEAEELLGSLLQGQRGGQSDKARYLLSELLFWEGRRDEMRRLLESAWKNTPDPVADLTDHWKIDGGIVMVDLIRSEVERSARLAPDDDRVWLAQARLALHDGRLDEAAALLDRCASRRPDDPSVWRARLDQAMAADDPSAARKAMERIPADLIADDERLAMAAWMAARSGDPEAERRALERLVADSPSDARALDRLGTLAWDAGRRDLARDYRRRKAESDAIKDRYRAILGERVTPAHFAELGRLALSLGRRFESRGWWTLRTAFAPGDREAAAALATLRTPRTITAPTRGLTLARAIDEIGPTTATTAAGPRSTPASPAELIVPEFAEVAEAAGLRFVFENGRSPLRQVPETTAGGVGLIDFDGDGRLDVYVVQGGVFPPDPSRPSTGDRLFRNRGDGSFEDATEQSGIARLSRGFGHGVTVGDFDNDGRPDLFLTRWRGYALYRNRGDGTFEDATSAAGLDGDRDWPTSAAFADLDNDGDLDLYVCHYLAWDADHPTLCDRVTATAAKDRVEPDQKYNYCSPRGLAALSDHLFRNDNGRFTDVTAEAGIVDRDGRGLGVVAADLDNDGKVDLFVANDTTANYLWHNLGGMKFEETGLSAGVACNADGAFQAGMGVACGDLDGDGRPDLMVTNFYGESTTYFRNLGGGMFGDRTAAVGLSGPSRYLLGFGIVLFDANNDGRLDLATANGHVNDDRPDYPYDMPALLLVGGADGRLVDVTKRAGAAWSTPRVARGLVSGDLDGDGRVDAIILPQKAPLGLLRNRTTGGHSITFAVEGTRSNRDGVGAVVTVVAGGRRQTLWRSGGGSFQSASSPRLHAGLGESTRVDSVEVRWPSGQVDRFATLPADRTYRLREGSTVAEPLALQVVESHALNPPRTPGLPR